MTKEIKKEELTAENFIKEFKALEEKYSMTIQAHIAQRVIPIEKEVEKK